jgi:hypothetical protein
MDNSKTPVKRHGAEEIVTKLRAGGRHSVCEEPTIDAITFLIVDRLAVDPGQKRGRRFEGQNPARGDRRLRSRLGIAPNALAFERTLKLPKDRSSTCSSHTSASVTSSKKCSSIFLASARDRLGAQTWMAFCNSARVKARAPSCFLVMLFVTIFLVQPGVT